MRAAFSGALLVIFALLAGATTAAAQPSGKVDPALVDRALAYLNGVRTLQARFVQRDQSGGRWTGSLWMARPGRLRFQYDPPVNDVIWADGGLVKHYDAALEALTHLPPSETPAWFLLDDQVRLKDDVRVLETSFQGDRYYLTAAQANIIGDARVTLAFAAEPDRILGWQVTDDTGAVTTLELIDMTTGGPLPRGIFKYWPPTEGN